MGWGASVVGGDVGVGEGEGLAVVVDPLVAAVVTVVGLGDLVTAKTRGLNQTGSFE